MDKQTTYIIAVVIIVIILAAWYWYKNMYHKACSKDSDCSSSQTCIKSKCQTKSATGVPPTS